MIPLGLIMRQMDCPLIIYTNLDTSWLLAEWH